MEYQEQNCPLCENIARYTSVDSGKRKIFSCNICKDFVITDNAERRLKNNSDERRSQLSDKCAKLSHSEFLHIFVKQSSDHEALNYKVETRAN